MKQMRKYGKVADGAKPPLPRRGVGGSVPEDAGHFSETAGDGMSWFAAVDVLARHVEGCGDAVVVEAWRSFLRSPFPHLGGLEDVETFLAAAERFAWDGRGLEFVVHRLALAVEALTERLPARATAGHGSGPFGASFASIRGYEERAVVDEFYQADFCESCGARLMPDGEHVCRNTNMED